MLRLVAEGAIAVALLLGGVSESYACSVSPTGAIKRGPKFAFEEAEDVFVGRVISSERVSEWEDLVTFEVSRVLKGDQAKVRALLQNRGRGCQFSHRIGVVYVFFINEVDDGSHSIRGLSGENMEHILSELGTRITGS